MTQTSSADPTSSPTSSPSSSPPVAPGEADLVLTGGRIWTGDAARPWAEALAVRDGVLVAVGSAADVAVLTGPGTTVHPLDGRFAMPGLVDGHIHLNIGGAQVFELPLLPFDDVETILAKVADWSAGLGPQDWVVGGIVGSPVMDALAATSVVHRLDAAAGGRPVLLRDDSMHNRWVSSRALELMGVDADTPDPAGGRYVRDAAGVLTGVVQESASGIAESVCARSVVDPAARIRRSVSTALKIANSFGITAVQEAATMAAPARALADLAAAGELTVRVVLSMPARPFIEDGTVGDALVAEVAGLRSDLIRPDFVKIALDGVPITRSAALLQPYRCDHGEPAETGSMYWELDELVAELEKCHERGLGAKVHATGDASVRRVLDAVEIVRGRRGAGPRVQIAHAEWVHPDDLPRFAALDVIADLSPYLWFPSVIHESLATHVSDELLASMWPVRALLDSGAQVAAGSDWPCAAPSPDPWTGLQTLVTRRNPDGSVPGELNPGQAVTLPEAVAAFTSGPAEAAGLGDVTGRLVPGLSADLIVLDRDLFAVDVEQLHRTTVLRTYFRGRVVHEAAPVPAEVG